MVLFFAFIDHFFEFLFFCSLSSRVGVAAHFTKSGILALASLVVSFALLLRQPFVPHCDCFLTLTSSYESHGVMVSYFSFALQSSLCSLFPSE